MPAAGQRDADVYREFLMAGIFAQTVTFATAGAGAGIADDMHKGLIDRFRSLPMARGAVLTGRTLADLVQTALTLVVLAVVALIVGWRVHESIAEVLGALRPAAPARVRLLLDRRADRPVRTDPRGGHLRRADLALPADLHLERVRAVQQDARRSCGTSPSGTRSAPRCRPAGSCSATRRASVVRRLADAAPGAGVGPLVGADHRGRSGRWRSASTARRPPERRARRRRPRRAPGRVAAARARRAVGDGR